MLAIEVRLGTTSGFTPSQVLELECATDTVSELLERLPPDRALHTLHPDEFDRWLGPASPGQELYDCLRRDIRLGAVATNKLLARKRPALIPVFDRQLQAALEPSGRWWEPWWVTLTTHPGLVERLEAIRDDAGAPDLSVLRVADIVVWMRQHGADTDRACSDLRQRVGPRVPPPGGGTQ